MNYINHSAAAAFILTAGAALADAVASEHGYGTAAGLAAFDVPSADARIAIEIATEEADDAAIISALVYGADASAAAMLALSEDELVEYAAEDAGLMLAVCRRARGIYADQG